MKNYKFEDDIILNNFKRKYFEDNSGYWFEKKFKFPIFDLRCYIEPDNNKLYLEASHKKEDVTIEFKVLNWRDCKKILKKYKLI
jgi:hypothetical protein